MPSTEAAEREDQTLLNLFCTPEGEAWRVYVRPSCWLPRYLHQCFDRHGEAYPVLADFDDLDRYMSKRSLTLEKRVSTEGDIELTARGEAAQALAVWLSTAFASGIRAPEANAERKHG